jgi:hypothetical protein
MAKLAPISVIKGRNAKACLAEKREAASAAREVKGGHVKGGHDE